MFNEAEKYLERGFCPIPLRYRGKEPAIRWREYTQRKPTVDELRELFGNGARNIGNICGLVSGVAVLDVDDKEKARELYRQLPKTPAMVETGKGVHFYYSIDEPIAPRVRIGGIQVDIRGEASYVVMPPSIHPSGKQYEWIYDDWNELPPFPREKIEEIIPTCTTPECQAKRKRITDGEAYIANIRAIAGEGGHNSTFRAACKLRDAGYDELEALGALIRWNQTNTDPLWTVEELTHKVRDAFKKGEGSGRLIQRLGNWVCKDST
ncbi:bifunctional DNA primase/polymerase [Symmachiella dynata]|uniref:bifunctional DNA primase/polymerase n=1 Tax=Symmachiella dynata TaxID=2527995 RepID=UPI0018D47E09|nr:bifunctional DNA primase/polymerase [Symmachiella dynata]